MDEFSSDKLWSLIKKYGVKSSAKQAAIAYVSSDAWLAFGEGDVLVTDASDAAIGGAQTSAKLLKVAHAKGAKLYSLAGLHAKVICFDRHLVVGSANASDRSASQLVEAGIVSDDPGLLLAARAFISQLVSRAVPIDKPFLKRIAKIEVKRPRPPRLPKKPKLRDSGAQRIWLVGVDELKEDSFPDERQRAAEGEKAAEAARTVKSSSTYWLRMTGNSRFHAEAVGGDFVLQIWTDLKKQTHVYLPALIIRRQKEPACTRFYIEEFEYSGRRSLPWRRFQKLWKQAVGTGSPPARCARLLRADAARALVTLWPK